MLFSIAGKSFLHATWPYFPVIYIIPHFSPFVQTLFTFFACAFLWGRGLRTRDFLGELFEKSSPRPPQKLLTQINAIQTGKPFLRYFIYAVRVGDFSPRAIYCRQAAGTSKTLPPLAYTLLCIGIKTRDLMKTGDS